MIVVGIITEDTVLSVITPRHIVAGLSAAARHRQVLIYRTAMVFVQQLIPVRIAVIDIAPVLDISLGQRRIRIMRLQIRKIVRRKRLGLIEAGRSAGLVFDKGAVKMLSILVAIRHLFWIGCRRLEGIVGGIG